MFYRISKYITMTLASILLIFCSQSIVWGLTLQESIAIAMENNLSVKAAQESLQMAEQKVKEALAGFMPVISASGSYTYFGEIPTTEMTINPSMFGIPVGGDNEQEPMEMAMGQEDTYQVGVSIQQPLFTWGKIFNGYKQAKLSFEAAKQELEAVRQQAILDVTISFYGVLLTEKLVDVTEMGVDQIKAHVDTAQKLVKAGVATDFDLLRARVELANTESQLIRAKNSLELAKDAFKNVLDMDLKESVALKGVLVYHPLDVDIDQLMKNALLERPEIKQLQFQGQSGEKLVSLAKAGNKPSLAFVGNYDYQSNANTLGDVFETDGWDDTWSVTLALQIPIFDGLKTRAQVKQAESGLRQMQIGLEQVKDAVSLEVRAAYFGFQEARELLRAQEETVEQAKESLRIANLRYKNGMITNVELMDAELAFTQAQTNKYNALHDYLVAIAKLEKSSASEIN